MAHADEISKQGASVSIVERQVIGSMIAHNSEQTTLHVWNDLFSKQIVQFMYFLYFGFLIQKLVLMFCFMNQDLERWWKLGEQDVMINVGSEQNVAATQIGSTSFHLYFEHVLVLKNCLVFPNGLKNIVFVVVLLRKGYVFKFGESN